MASTNGVSIKGLWHATAMDASYDGLYEPMNRLFGAIVMHDHESHDPAIGRRGGMIWLGDNSIEIGSPLGETSPVRNFVEKWGGGMHSLALQIEDSKQTQAFLAEKGVKPIAFVDEDIFFTSPSGSCGLLLEWSAGHTDDDPRWGFPLRELDAPPVVEVPQYAFVTAVVDAPAEVAARLAELFGTSIVRLRQGAAPGEIAAIVDLRDCLLVLFAMPATGTSVGLWGSDIRRGRLHAHGLRVDDLGAARSALEQQGVTVHHELEGMLYLDPTRTGLPTFLCERLLPEDPRN